MVWRKGETAESMFHQRYEPEPNSGCWLWLGAGDKNGYGQFAPGRERWKAHRYSWQLHNGEIPDGMMVCHKCDTPACVNPSHLFLGSAKDNSSDMYAKGRKPDGLPGALGAANPSSKLTAGKVREIRAADGSCKSIGSRYGISAAMVSLIKRRECWGHVREVIE